MPAPKKKAAVRRGSSKKAEGGTDSNSKSKSEHGSVRSEIAAIITIAASLLLLISLFTEGGAGAFGAFINGLLISLFGLGAWVVPFAVIITCVVVIFADGRRILRSHIIMLCCLFSVIISLVHIIGMEQGLSFQNLWEYIKYYYTSGSAKNGGLFGAVVGNALFVAIGRSGSYIFLITAGTVLLILITGRSLFSYLRKLRDQAGTVIEKQRKVYVEKGTLKGDVKPIRVDSMRNNKVEVYNLPKNSGKKPFFNHKIEGHDGRASDNEKLDVINEHLRGGITRPKYSRNAKAVDEPKILEFKFKPHEPDQEIESDPELELSESFEDGGSAPWEEELTGTFAGDPEEDFEITVKGVGIEGVGLAIPAGAKPALEEEISVAISATFEDYEYPPISLLNENDYEPSVSTLVQIKENSKKLEETLRSFGVEAKVVEVSKGPTVTRYELSPGLGVKVNKISGLADDLALSLAATGIRIEAPIPGKSAVGIEIPNKVVQPVFLREVIDDPAFRSSASKLTFAVGKDITGNTVISDIAKMPHLLIAGSTGSGKSVCINALITSLLYKARPDEVKLLMIDPKVVELSIYNGIPHLLIPVVTEPKKASGALNWAVLEMERRYGLLASVGTRDIKGYNAVAAERGDGEILPQIVIIIDELADLMLQVGKEVEDAICRIAQKARAAGIHLIVATQRPSVNVITGTIKANVGSRLAFAVSSGIDSRTILDQNGAERLLGKGDMLFSPMGLSKPQRIQCAFISDKEVERIVGFLKADGEHEYDPDMIEEITTVTTREKPDEGNGELSSQLIDAVELIYDKDKASTSMLQRYFRIGYNSAARLMEEIEGIGVVGPEDGSKPRKLLMTRADWDRYKSGV